MVHTTIETHPSAFSHELHKCMVTKERSVDAHHVDHRRVRIIDDGIKRLYKKNLPGKHHAECYLRHKYRLNLQASTLQGTISFIQHFLTFLNHIGKNHLEQLTRRDLESFIEHEQDRGLLASTVSTKVKCMKAFVRFLIEETVIHPELLFRRLTIKVPEPLPRAIPLDDVRQLLSVIKEVGDRAMVLVLLRTGMRIGELLKTKISHVLIRERKIVIFEGEKNRVGRVVYLSDDALRALKAWVRERDPRKEYLFYAQGRDTMCYTTARTMFHRYLLKAGLDHKGYSLHSLRHTFATELLNAGMRLECLQPLLGHNSLEITRRYARLTDKTREEEYFRAMSIIERGQNDEHYQLDSELQAILEEAELFTPHR
jgi:site-specific recombinase XerD